MIKNKIKSFTYEGLTFKPMKTLRGKDSDFFEISKRINNIGITPNNWSYNEFYRVAKENGAGKIDLFEVNGITVIPASRILFEYRN